MFSNLLAYLDRSSLTHNDDQAFKILPPTHKITDWPPKLLHASVSASMLCSSKPQRRTLCTLVGPWWSAFVPHLSIVGVGRRYTYRCAAPRGFAIPLVRSPSAPLPPPAAASLRLDDEQMQTKQVIRNECPHSGPRWDFTSDAGGWQIAVRSVCCVVWK